MKSSNNSVDSKPSKPSFISKTSFYVGSLATISFGFLFGVSLVFRKNDEIAPLKSVRGAKIDKSSAFLMATKALGLGTMLCLGTFFGVGSIFVATTGITSVKEFDVAARSIGVLFKPKEKEYSNEEKLEHEQHEQDMNDFLKEYFSDNNKKSDDKQL
eukprot:gene6893-9445_t